MYVELPAVTATPEQRLKALRDAKTLMSGSEPGAFSAMFSASAAGPGPGREAIDGFLRLAEYITTGHDYQDTHPVGKRRPKTVVNVTVISPEAPDQEDLDHLLGHILNGDFDPKQDSAEGEESAGHDWTPAREDVDAGDPSAEADPGRDSVTPPKAWDL